jgi:hypothetical protein
MKVYKTLTISLLSLICVYTTVFPQASLTIGTLSGAPGNDVSIPVQASGIADMVGFQFTIVYDNTKLAYVNCSNWGGGTNSAGVQITPLTGRITFVYNDAAVNITSGTFFNLNFNIIGGSTGNASIGWSDSPTMRELSNSIPEEINCTYSDGGVNIINLPVAPTGVSASPNPICVGGSTTLSYTGGSGTTFNWYSTSCGNTIVGSGNNLPVSPTITTTYYGRWENSSGNSDCVSVTVTVNPLPTAPTSVSASPNPICVGGSTTLSYNGGSGTTFRWYTSSCGGTLVGSGNNFSVSPTVTTTYYGRWENSCGNSACQSVTVTVNPAPVAPTSVSASPNTICVGGSSTLTYSGGSGTTFRWYTSSCGGTLVGSGNNFSVSPTVTTTYYGRWENSCGNSACQSVTVTVNPAPVAPTSVSASPNPICVGGSAILTYSGGSGTTFRWYTSSCGGTLVGSGNNLPVSPTVTTTYYGRWENSCGNSACQSVTVTVNPAPIAPTSVSASLNTICVGGSSTLTYSGGSGTIFNWYTSSCGGTLVGSGNNLSVSPTVTTTYYGRWENSCGNSACQSVTVTVNPAPVAPTSVSASPNTICEGGSTTLSYNGGSGTTFRWYTSSCGGTLVGSGNNLPVSPTVTTTYYGRWENSCGNSACQSVTVTVNPAPVAPTSVSASPNPICVGGSSTLTYSGGSGTTFRWYTSSCGGTLVGSGNNLPVSPTITTTYYGRWENSCGNSACQSVTVTVNPAPVAPISVSASPNTICVGGSSTLTYSGGSGTTFRWYTSSCGGTLVGSGNNLPVSPTVTTTYYGRWENSCGNSACQSVTVTVNPAPVAPTSVSASPNPICVGGSTTLSYNGGSGTTFRWYTSSCGGTLVGSGNNLPVSPTVTTTYYGRWENSCGNSACQSVTVTVNPAPVAPTSVSASPNTICVGASSTLTYSGGSGTTFRWYTSSCGGTLVGSGNNLPVSPTITTTYYGRWENSCGNSACQSVTVTVNPAPVAPISVSASPNTICVGGSSTLTYSGGSGTTFRWYTSSCGGTLVGSGNNLPVSPTVTTTYYGRWENSCGNSACQSVTVTVNPAPVAPTSVSASPNPICVGGSTTLSYNGGSGTTFRWYTSSCGGTLVGSGNNLSVSPTVTTTYYGRWDNSCGNSACISLTVMLNAAPEKPGDINGPSKIVSGTTQTFSISAINGALRYKWSYSGNGTLIENDTSAILTPISSGTLSVVASNNCGDSPQRMHIIDVGDPYISVDPLNLVFEDVIVEESVIKSYLLSGGNLTETIAISAPNGYQVSLSENTGFASSISVGHTGGSLGKTIYVKFCPTIEQDYNGVISNASSGATTVNVEVSGKGKVPQVPVLTVSPTSLTLASTSGSNGSISVTSNVTWAATDDATWLTLSPSSGTNNGTITVTASSANTQSTDRTATVTITGSGITRTVTVTQTGTASLTVCFEDKFTNLDNWILFGSPLPQLVNTTGNPSPCFDNNGDASYNSGAISKNTFDYSNGLTIETDMYVPANPNGCWMEGMFGIAKSTNIGSTTWPGALIHYEYRYSGSLCWADTDPKDEGLLIINILTEDGSGESYSIPNLNDYLNAWHRYKIEVHNDRRVSFYIDDSHIYTSIKSVSLDYNNMPLLLGSRSSSYGKVYHDNVKVYCGVPSIINLSADPTSLTFGDVDISNCSTKPYMLTGKYLTTNVTVTAPNGYQVSLSENTGFASSVTVGHTGGSLGKTIYVKFCPIIEQDYNGVISNASSGATTVNVEVSGKGTAPKVPVLTVSPASLTFGDVEISNCSTKPYLLSGNYLTSNVTVTAPSGYQASLNENTGFASSITVLQTEGSLSRTIYVKFCPTLEQNYNGLISNASAGATTVNLEVSGKGIPKPVPVLTVSQASLTFGDVETSNCKTIPYQIAGNYLTTNVTVAAPSGYQVSLSENAGFASSITVGHTGGSLGKTIFVKFCPTIEQDYTGVITNASSGATTVNVEVSGKGIPKPRIKIVSPKDGHSWREGEIVSIIWESIGVEKVDIYCEKNRSNIWGNPIFKNVPSTNPVNTQNWKVDGVANFYRIKIVSCSNESIYDISDYVLDIPHLNDAEETSFIIFPNPTDNVIYLRVSNNIENDVTARLIDNLGKEVYYIKWSELRANETYKIDLSAVNYGVYYLQISNSKFMKIEKVIKR